jgi:hypothetical protein
MQNTEDQKLGSSRAHELLAEAERAAKSAIRTMRRTLALAPAGSVGSLLEDVETLFFLIDAADLRAELARATLSPADAIEHAEDARSLARAAHAEAVRRAGKWKGRDAERDQSVGQSIFTR